MTKAITSSISYNESSRAEKCGAVPTTGPISKLKSPVSNPSKSIAKSISSMVFDVS